MEQHQGSKEQYIDNKILNLSLFLPWQNDASGLYISLSVDMPRLKRHWNPQNQKYEHDSDADLAVYLTLKPCKGKLISSEVETIPATQEYISLHLTKAS